MADGLVHRESALEFFKEQVEGAMQRQRLRTSEWTAFYVVNLLARQVPAGRANGMSPDEPLGLSLVRSLQAAGSQQREGLREVGDAALFLAGFFADSLQRRLVDVDYYVALGGFAYRRLAQAESDAFADVFEEMAEKFVPLVDVLSDISERAALGNTQDLLRLYERWVRTGSSRNEDLLLQHGIIPSAGSTRLQ